MCRSKEHFKNLTKAWCHQVQKEEKRCKFCGITLNNRPEILKSGYVNHGFHTQDEVCYLCQEEIKKFDINDNKCACCHKEIQFFDINYWTIRGRLCPKCNNEVRKEVSLQLRTGYFYDLEKRLNT